MLQRGPESIAITKVKGHADFSDVSAGLITEEDRLGNHHADVASDAAHRHHPRFLQEVLSSTVDRHRQYAVLVQVVQLTLLRVTERVLERHRAMAQVAPAQDVVVARGVRRRPFKLHMLTYADNDATERLLLGDQPVVLATMTNKWPHPYFFGQLHRFLAALQFQLVAGNDPGVTWLELLMLFEQRADVAVPTDLGHQQRFQGPLDPHVPIRTLVRNFSNASRQILQRQIAPAQHPTLLSANPNAGVRLRRIGSSTALATVGFVPDVSETENVNIHRAVLVMLGHMGAEPIRLLLQANLWRPLKAMNCSLGPTWTRPCCFPPGQVGCTRDN